MSRYPDAGDFYSPRSSRAASFSSERTTMSVSLFVPPQLSVTPLPAYVAAAAASQIVTDQHNAQLRDQAEPHHDQSEFEDVALFADEPLSLVNSFLDNLLYSFLYTARSSSLSAIRPAIVEVLKRRLAQEAIANADQELQDMLAGEPEDEEDINENGAAGKWELARVWKRTRLRVMVYTRLGEMEDEDEEHYIAMLDQDGQENPHTQRDPRSAGMVSWAAAIFLTSVIEHVAEQCLIVCGQAAFARAAKDRKRLLQEQGGAQKEMRIGERVHVEEFDAEKIALNPQLGRLWRTWRKRTRSPGAPMSPYRSSSDRSRYNGVLSRSRSFDQGEGSVLSYDDASRLSMDRIPGPPPTEAEIAANIPLPMGSRDVDEIEVPGLAKDPNHVEEEAQTSSTSRRPISVVLLTSPQYLQDNLAQQRSSRQRPISLPPPPTPAYDSYTFSADDDATQEQAPASAISDEQAHFHIDENQPDVSPLEEGSGSFPMHISAAQMATAAAATAATAATGVAAAVTGLVAGTATEPPSAVSEVYSEKDKVLQKVVDEDQDIEVRQSKRLSIESPASPPQVVRNLSRRSTSNSSTPLGTPDLEKQNFKLRNVPHSIPQDTTSSEDPNSIGMALSSNVALPAAPAPPSPKAEMASASINFASDLQDMPNVEHYLQNDRPESLEAPPKSEKRPSPIETGAAVSENDGRSGDSHQRQRSTSKNLAPLTPVQESHNQAAIAVQPNTEPVTEPSHAKSVNKSPAQPQERRARTDSSTSGTRTKYIVDDTRDRSTLQRVSTGSQGASVGSSILHASHPSDGSVTVTRPRGLSQRMSEDEKARTFDTLLSSKDTVKFTLTPSSMREAEGFPTPPSPVVNRDNFKVTVLQRTSGPAPIGSSQPVAPIPTAPVASTSASTQSGPSMRNGAISAASLERAASPTSRPAPTNFNRGGHVTAREPRVQTESMRDFADYIRTTGPDREAKETRPILAASPTPSYKNSSLGRRLSGRVRSRSNTRESNDGPTARPRKQMEPRSPNSNRDGSAELIDFIRQGPPLPKGGHQHRIDRHVAPFRSTMDSDEFNNLYGNRSPDSATPSESIVGSAASRTTINSRSGLLPAAKTSQPTYGSVPHHGSSSSNRNASAPSIPSAFDDEPTITRTRRRIKDPYAIDSDDDDNDDVLTALPKQRRQEESLMDFLNNVEPPSQNQPAPILNPSAAIASARQPRSQPNTQTSGYSNGPSAAPASSSAAPASSNAASSNGTRQRGPVPNMGGAARPRIAAREPQPIRGPTAGRQTGTSDLADFLTNSGPPELIRPSSSAMAYGPKTAKEKKKGWGFWKKQEA